MDTHVHNDASSQVKSVDKLVTSRPKAVLLLCGGLAGCIAKTAVAPFDRVKILLQTHNQAHKSHGIFQSLKHIWSKEGVAGLFRSNGVQMIRIFPYSAIQFFSFEVFFENLSQLNGESNTNRLISGSMAGMTAVALTYPLDVVRTRLAFQAASAPAATSGAVPGYRGVYDCLCHLHAQRALFAGLGPSLIGMAPYAGVSFCAFYWLQRLVLEHWPAVFAEEATADGEGNGRLRLWARPLIGGLAGAAAQTVSYPLDSTRRAMQVAGAPGREFCVAGATATLSDLYHRHGVTRGLFRGLSLNYLRVVPTAGISFAAYETIKQAFGVQ